jgi:phosphate transport system substrate-binding protein
MSRKFMYSIPYRKSLYLFVAGLLSLMGFAQAEVLIKGEGASFPSRVYERWGQRFAQDHPGVKVNYAPTGSGRGVQQVSSRAVHFGGTDNALTAEQLAQKKLVQIPLVVGGLVPVVNLPGVGPDQLTLSGPVLAEIMLGELRMWNDPRIAALNPQLRLPALPIKRIVREDASGSSELLARYLAQSSPAFAAKVPVSQAPPWPGQPIRARSNDGIVASLRDNAGAVSYVSFDRVRSDRLASVRLRQVSGSVVAASEDAFKAAILGSDLYRKGDDTASLLGLERTNAWPLTATSYVLLDAAPKDAVTHDWVARFVYWCFVHGDELTKGTGFAPLPDRVQAKLSGRLMQIHGPDGQMPQLATP